MKASIRAFSLAASAGSDTFVAGPWVAANDGESAAAVAAAALPSSSRRSIMASGLGGAAPGGKRQAAACSCCFTRSASDLMSMGLGRKVTPGSPSSTSENSASA